jgi:hypothetical protein
MARIAGNQYPKQIKTQKRPKKMAKIMDLANLAIDIRRGYE